MKKKINVLTADVFLNPSISPMNWVKAVFFLFLIMGIGSCKKHEEKEDVLLAAKKWHLNLSEKTTSFLKSNKGTTLKVEEELHWNIAQAFKFDDGTEIVSVPVSVKPVGEKVKGSYMVLISRIGDTFKSQTVYNGNPGIFTGNMSRAEIAKLYTSLNNISTSGKIASAKARGKLMVDYTGGGMSDEIACTAWFLVETFYYSDGSIAFVQETYLYTTCSSSSEGDSGGSGTGTVDCAGVRNGTAYLTACGCIGGTTGITECARDIRNKTTDACISKTVDEVLKANKNLTGALQDIIKKFDASKAATINIYDGNIYNSNGSPKPGQTTDQQFIGNSFSANITLGKEYHAGTSKENLITTLIHEFVHAYLGYTSNNFLKTETDHNVIANKYVTPMATYLKDYFNIPLKDAYALAWSGVPDSKVWSEAAIDFEFTMSDGNKISKQETQSLSGLYKDTNSEPTSKGSSICN